MRWFKRGLAIFGSFLLLLIGGLWVLSKVEEAEYESFYAAHPMLRTMRDAPAANARGIDSFPHMTDVLFARIPPGSTRQDAVRILSSEGIECEWIESQKTLACEPKTPPPHVPRWYIELTFDQDDKVLGGRVSPLKATAT